MRNPSSNGPPTQALPISRPSPLWGDPGGSLQREDSPSYKWMSNTPSSTVCTSSSRISVERDGSICPQTQPSVPVTPTSHLLSQQAPIPPSPCEQTHPPKINSQKDQTTPFLRLILRSFCQSSSHSHVSTGTVCLNVDCVYIAHFRAQHI